MRGSGIYYGCGFACIILYLSGAVAPLVFWATTKNSRCALASPTLSSFVQTVGIIMCCSIVAILLTREGTSAARVTDGLLALINLSWVSFGTILVFGGFVPEECHGTRLYQFAMYYLIAIYVLIVCCGFAACALNSLLGTIGRIKNNNSNNSSSNNNTAAYINISNNHGLGNFYKSSNNGYSLISPAQETFLMNNSSSEENSKTNDNNDENEETRYMDITSPNWEDENDDGTSEYARKAKKENSAFNVHQTYSSFDQYHQYEEENNKRKKGGADRFPLSFSSSFAQNSGRRTRELDLLEKDETGAVMM